MSGRKLVLPQYKIISAGDMSQTSITSSVTNIEYYDNIAIQLVWTGTPVGTFSVQGSVSYSQDYLGNVTNTGTWDTITLSPNPTATGAAGDILINMQQLAFPWIRVVYIKGSSTGTLNAWIAGKQI